MLTVEQPNDKMMNQMMKIHTVLHGFVIGVDCPLQPLRIILALTHMNVLMMMYTLNYDDG